MEREKRFIFSFHSRIVTSRRIKKKKRRRHVIVAFQFTFIDGSRTTLPQSRNTAVYRSRQSRLKNETFLIRLGVAGNER